MVKAFSNPYEEKGKGAAIRCFFRQQVIRFMLAWLSQIIGCIAGLLIIAPFLARVQINTYLLSGTMDGA